MTSHPSPQYISEQAEPINPPEPVINAFIDLFSHDLPEIPFVAPGSVFRDAESVWSRGAVL
jgi:hypothetical protein